MSHVATRQCPRPCRPLDNNSIRGVPRPALVPRPSRGGATCVLRGDSGLTGERDVSGRRMLGRDIDYRARYYRLTTQSYCVPRPARHLTRVSQNPPVPLGRDPSHAACVVEERIELSQLLPSRKLTHSLISPTRQTLANSGKGRKDLGRRRLHTQDLRPMQTQGFGRGGL